MSLSDKRYNGEWVRIPNRGNSEINYLIDNVEVARKGKGNFSRLRYSEVYPDSSHVHCEICWMTIANGNSNDIETGGYYANETWVCDQCFHIFIEPEDYMRVVDTFERIPKP
ncbi:hypothetical protein [Hymenobacter sp. CRA2]|uniref:hypothetical protein n=1 Tax=Hymenobacter sp. CRA2 TaxID=1955620 RepID=UPI001116B293|nr:hypothetical protein [Hymenobacter sp. CRA2]